MKAGYGLYLLQTLGALLLVVALAYITLKWGLKRLYRDQKGDTKRIRILERRPLDPRRALYLIEVDKKEVLLGVSEREISLLMEIKQGHKEDGD
jgi:flagellar biosynthetic protein FliO